jgi:hypothetical protein
MNLDIVISYLKFLSHELGIILQVSYLLFLIWKNALMYVSGKIYIVAFQSYLEVVDPDCGSVIMEQNRENEVSQKYPSYKGDAANR